MENDSQLSSAIQKNPDRHHHHGYNHEFNSIYGKARVIKQSRTTTNVDASVYGKRQYSDSNTQANRKKSQHDSLAREETEDFVRNRIKKAL